MSNAPLMPKATAVWLLDNTALTFDQVADFTKMHPLEVRAIADGDAAQGSHRGDHRVERTLSRELVGGGLQLHPRELGELRGDLLPQHFVEASALQRSSSPPFAKKPHVSGAR